VAIAATSIAAPHDQFAALIAFLRGDDTQFSHADLSFAIRQGLAPQLYRRLPQLRPRLEERFQQNLRRSLLLSSELPRLLDALPPAIAFKGPVLAQRLYGDFAAREYCDLDLLLRPDDIPAAIATLGKMGFTAALPLEPWQLQAHLRSGCEYAMSDGRIHVELHWQYVPRQFGNEFDLEQLFVRAAKVPIGDREIPALSPEDDLLMLTVHATKHGWNKLAYVADIAALLRACPMDWDYVKGEALDRRTGLGFCIACMLADWCGAPLPEDVRSVAANDRETKPLVEVVKRNFENGADLDEDLAARHRFIRASRDTSAERLAYLLRYALIPTLDDWNYVRLPRGLRWLYPAARLVRLATKSSTVSS